MMQGKILIVDDEEFNRDIVRKFLAEERFDIIDCQDGQEAWERLSAGEKYDAVLLDRMMPRLNGMELLDKMKRDPNLRRIPVILQTSASANEQIAEGISLGAFYYLTKPFDRSILLAVVRSALMSGREQAKLSADIAGHKGIIHLTQSATYQFSTLDNARALVVSLSGAAADPYATGLGLMELLVNAVEHGNLGISFEEKVRLLTTDTYEDEIRRRMELSENQAKRVKVEFSRQGSDIEFRITDEGAGFDWKQYLEMSPRRALARCGRGILLARSIVFHSVEYSGNGNVVLARTSRSHNPTI